MKKGKKLLSMIALSLLAVVVFAFSGCFSHLEGHVKITDYGLTGQVWRNANNYWIPGGCKPEQEEVFVQFTAEEEFGEIHAGYYMICEWNEVKNTSGVVLSETTTTVIDNRAEYRSIDCATNATLEKSESGCTVKFSGLPKGQYAVRITGVKGTAEEVAAYNRYEKQMNAYFAACDKYEEDLAKYEENLAAYWDGTISEMPTEPTVPTKPIKPASVASLEGNNVEVVVKVGGYKECFDESGKLIPNDYPVKEGN
ncbi:MAG: hypothetical protein NC114_08950 [Ruminococcus flavefaciens]|nr:hypothetical protein [Ruminococcus flavefaciens]